MRAAGALQRPLVMAALAAVETHREVGGAGLGAAAEVLDPADHVPLAVRAAGLAGDPQRRLMRLGDELGLGAPGAEDLSAARALMQALRVGVAAQVAARAAARAADHLADLLERALAGRAARGLGVERVAVLELDPDQLVVARGVEAALGQDGQQLLATLRALFAGHVAFDAGQLGLELGPGVAQLDLAVLGLDQRGDQLTRLAQRVAGGAGPPGAQVEPTQAQQRLGLGLAGAQLALERGELPVDRIARGPQVRVRPGWRSRSRTRC